MQLFNDPNLLLSYINTKLRDQYKNLEDLCYDLDYSIEELEEKLMKIGYKYNHTLNAFVYVGGNEDGTN